MSKIWRMPRYSCARMLPASSPALASLSMAAWVHKSKIKRNDVMSVKKPVIVYGASGYTGRLICEFLRELNVPFIAAGRDAARVQNVMNRIPGIESADYEVVQVEHTVEALTELFRGAK